MIHEVTRTLTKEVFLVQPRVTSWILPWSSFAVMRFRHQESGNRTLVLRVSSHTRSLDLIPLVEKINR
jgi:tRNA A37 threonylcarbamoyladenosine synthetase subunit TsaC/SUA5/YrdC